MAGPVHCTIVTAIEPVEPPADGVEHLLAAERLGIAVPLQLETRLVDAARGIDRQHQQNIGGRQRLGLRLAARRDQASQTMAMEMNFSIAGQRALFAREGQRLRA